MNTELEQFLLEQAKGFGNRISAGIVSRTKASKDSAPMADSIFFSSASVKPMWRDSK